MKNKALILVIFLASFLRLFWLDRVPAGVVNDEIDSILNAKSVYLAGSDISHTWHPLSLTAPSSGFPTAEIVPLLTAWGIGPLPLSPFYSKLPYVIVSIWLVVCIYLVTETLIGPQVALVAGIIASINPWLIYFGRSAYDMPVAITAMVSGLYILLMARGWKILWSFPLFMAGFYGYTGATSLLVLPFVALSAGYAWHVVHKRAYTLQYVLLFVLCLTCFGRYAWQGMHSAAGIGGQLSTPFRPEIAQITDNTRKLSIQSPLLPIIVNKYTQFIRISAEKYTGAFSADFLFLRGDSTAQFAVREHGVMYLPDAVFLLIGIGALYAKKRKVFYLFAAIICIAPVPGVLSIVGTSYAFLSMLMAPVLCVLIAAGIHEFAGNNRMRVAGIAFLYILSLGNFLYVYVYRSPVYASDSFSRSGRVLAKYLSLAEVPVYIVHSDPQVPLKQYLFYTDSLKKQTSKEIAETFRTKSYHFKNLHFITCSHSRSIPAGSTVIYEDPQCPDLPEQKNPLSIGRLNDGGVMYRIASDRICGLYDLKRYPDEIWLENFNVERLTRMSFCQAHITRD